MSQFLSFTGEETSLFWLYALDLIAEGKQKKAAVSSV